MSAWIFTLFLSLCQAQAASVHSIMVRGSINPGSAAYILESLQAAELAKADALVLQLDTPGGLLVSTRSIIQGISESAVPVIVWISPGGASATSAGALITLSAHVSAMAPGTNLGAAHPVGSQGEDVKGAMGEKVTNDTAALARAQATLRGRSAETAEAIVTKSRSFSAEEAVKSGAVDFIAGDLEELLRKAQSRKVLVEHPRREVSLQLAGVSATGIVRREMTAKQSFLHFISDPNVSALLLTLGGLAMWAEVSSGFSSIAAGVVGLFCFVLGLMSLQTLPVNVGGALLLLSGLGLLVAEAFVTSYGLLTVAALASLLLGGLFLIDPAAGSMHVSLLLLLSIVGGVGIVVLLVGYLFSRDRHNVVSTKDPVVGAFAKIATVERGGTQGTAYVNGELWSFESAEAFHANEEARVRSQTGMCIYLERKN